MINNKNEITVIYTRDPGYKWKKKQLKLKYSFPLSFLKIKKTWKIWLVFSVSWSKGKPYVKNDTTLILISSILLKAKIFI